MHEDRALGDRIDVVVAPRQRWSQAVVSLEAVLEHLPDGAGLVYVDGGSPDHVRRRLEAMIDERGGSFIRIDCVLTSSEAKNLALARCSREFVVFIENDVVPRAGWIEHLVACADETGADMVGPLILHGATADGDTVHIAGGDLEIHDGVMDVNERHDNYQPLAEVIDRLERRPSTQLEFHALMVRRELLDRLGPLDEELRSIADHEDLLLSAHELGATSWFEPASVVTFIQMAHLTDDEVGYWQLRWSEDWNRRSLEHFCRKWDIAQDKGWPVQVRLWSTRERSRWYHGRTRVHGYAGKAFRFANRRRFSSWLVRDVEDRVMGGRGRSERDRRLAVLGHD